MEQQKVDMFMMTNKKYFPEEKMMFLREKLVNAPDEKYAMVSTMSFKDPTISLVLSIFLGSLGIDRFFVGDIGLGVLKLLTCGCCGVFTIIDWFLIMGRTKEKNFNDFMAFMA